MILYFQRGHIQSRDAFRPATCEYKYLEDNHNTWISCVVQDVMTVLLLWEDVKYNCKLYMKIVV